MKSTMLSIFIGMFFYGLISNHLGGALLAIFFLLVIVYGSSELEKRDEEYYADPRSATKEPSTLAELDKGDCEASGSKL